MKNYIIKTALMILGLFISSTGRKTSDLNYLIINQNDGIDTCYSEFYYKFYSNKIKVMVEGSFCRDISIVSNTLDIKNLDDCIFSIKSKKEFSQLDKHKIYIVEKHSKDTLLYEDLIYGKDTLRPTIFYTSLGLPKRAKGTINEIDSIYCKLSLNRELNDNIIYYVEQFNLTTITNTGKRIFNIKGPKVPSEVRKELENIRGEFDIVIDNVKVNSEFYKGTLSQSQTIKIFR